VWNDDRPVGTPSWTGFRPNKISYLFHTWYLIQIAVSRPPVADYGPAIQYVIELNQLVEKDGARLAVILFRKRSSPEWDYFVSKVLEGLEDTSIPVRDLGIALENHDFKDLIVHPIDVHPNEVAHRLAAEDVLAFLVSEDLVPSP
jgi:hypothetical protein